LKNLQVCVIGPKDSGKSVVVSRLQQKKELQDENFSVYSFKVGDALVYLAEAPYDMASPKPMLAAMAEADACLLCVPAGEGIQKLGELILLINYMKISKGVIAITKTDMAPDKVDALKALLPKVLAETSLKHVEIIPTSSMTEEGFTDVRTALTQLEPRHHEQGPFKLPVETPQEIKSGFTTVTGVIERGSVKKHDKTFLMPWGKEFIVQEIKRESQVVESAKAGDRVDILYKGLNKWDVQQGDIIAVEGTVHKAKKLKLEFEISKFFKDELRADQEIQLNIGLQTLPVTITKLVKAGVEVGRAITGEKVEIEVESKLPFAFEKHQTVIIISPEAHWRSIKVAGSGKVIEGMS
jgi:selenocysteine-specific translation elongation factor